MERLQKILSQAGVASRRASEQLMLDGRVTVNGETVRQLGAKADAGRDDIRVDGRRIRIAARHRYILLNKPRGYVSTRSDPQRRPTVLDLVPGVTEYVYPVGRLDFDSEGLIILTNDGDLAARLTHPRHGIARVYDAKVLGEPDQHDLTRLRHGIVIDGRRTEPAEVTPLGPGHLRIVVREGRNRQVRKMCEAIGHAIDKLTRVAIGPLTDPRLRPGHWRELTEAEVRKLQTASAGHTARAFGTKDQERTKDQGRTKNEGRTRDQGRTKDQARSADQGRTKFQVRTRNQGRSTRN